MYVGPYVVYNATQAVDSFINEKVHKQSHVDRRENSIDDRGAKYSSHKNIVRHSHGRPNLSMVTRLSSRSTPATHQHTQEMSYKE